MGTHALDDVFQWKEERRMGQNLTVHYNRVIYLVEPTDDQKALRGKRINVTESAEGTVRLYASKQLTAEPFAKDGRVTK